MIEDRTRPEQNPLQALIAEHMANTGDNLADIAARGGLPRQTVSGLLHRDGAGGIPRRATLAKLATGLGVSLATVTRAAAQSAGATQREPVEGRLAVLVDTASGLQARDLDTVLVLARALARTADDTPVDQ